VGDRPTFLFLQQIPIKPNPDFYKSPASLGFYKKSSGGFVFKLKF